MGHQPFPAAIRQRSSNRVVFLLLTFELPNNRGGSIKHGNRAKPFLYVAVNIRNLRRQQSVCLRSDLMRSAVVDM
jgi:hypothetical protein